MSKIQEIISTIDETTTKALRREPGEDVATYTKDPEWITLEDVRDLAHEALVQQRALEEQLAEARSEAAKYRDAFKVHAPLGPPNRLPWEAPRVGDPE